MKKPKITPTASVIAGWNGTVAGVEALAESIERGKMEKRGFLIKALEAERDQFKHRGQDTKDHDITIQYLKSGSTTHNPDAWDLLYAAVYDFDLLCSDYGV